MLPPSNPPQATRPTMRVGIDSTSLYRLFRYVHAKIFYFVTLLDIYKRRGEISKTTYGMS